MWVTAYVDASFHQADGGGWAIWLRSESGRVVDQGRCVAAVDSLAAELEAIVVAVERALAEWPHTTGVLIRSDCQGALALANLKSRRAPTSKPHAALVERLRKAVLSGGGPVYLRLTWVKGHQNPKVGVQAYLNNAVDHRSRNARKGSM